MQIRFTARHSEFPDDIKAIIEEKLERLENTFGRITEAHVTIEPIKHEIKLDINLHVKNIHITAFDQDENLRDAIDVVTEKLEAQLRKNKGRRLTHKRISIGEFAEATPLPEQKTEVPKVKIRKTAPTVLSLTEEEAIDEIKSSGEAFLVFHNQKSKNLAILFPNVEGGYTILEPKLPK